MSDLSFSYDDYEDARRKLIDAVTTNLDRTDKRFLLSFNQLQPDWSVYEYQRFPSVKWKLFNLDKFKENSPEAYILNTLDCAASSFRV